MHDLIWLYWTFGVISILVSVFWIRNVSIRWKPIFFFVGLKSAISLLVGVILFRSVYEQTQMPFLMLFVDWFVTTPLTVVILWLLFRRSKGIHEATQDISYLNRSHVVGLVAINWAMIGFGFAADVWRESYGLRWGLFACSAVMMGWLFVRMMRMRQVAESKQREEEPNIFLIASRFILMSWLVFPLIWLVSPRGLNWISITQTEACFWAFNLLVKMGFFVILLIYAREPVRASDQSTMRTGPIRSAWSNGKAGEYGSS